MITHTVYSATALATGGRDGHARSTDGTLEVTLAVPKEMGGTGEGNNPEQLFAAGYAACFLGAMKFVSSQGGYPKVPDDTVVKATVGIGPRTDKGFGLAISLAITVPGMDLDIAHSLIAEADTICPYSHAVRGNVEVSISTQ